MWPLPLVQASSRSINGRRPGHMTGRLTLESAYRLGDLFGQRRARLARSMRTLAIAISRVTKGQKKAGMAKHREVFDHAGLLFNTPPGIRRVAFRLVIRQLQRNP